MLSPVLLITQKHKRCIIMYARLTKQGIVLFVLLSGLAGFALSWTPPFELEPVVLLLAGLYFVSSGSFAINQAQEWQLDKKMHRTRLRPIPLGKLQTWQVYVVGFLFCSFGLMLLFLLSTYSGFLALLTLILYNIFYTLMWKKKMIFAAVPGALPGALPVLIGYAAHGELFTAASCYLFLIMFLWQMPHFWSLSIHYKNDYKRAGVPVLPVCVGTQRTLYHIGLYVFSYVGVAMAAPFFVPTAWLHLLLVVPLCCKVLWEFVKFFRSQYWLPFFLWVNMSLIVFLITPVLDKWLLI